MYLFYWSHTNHRIGLITLDNYSKWHNALDKMRPPHHWSVLRKPLLQQKRNANMQLCSAVRITEKYPMEQDSEDFH